MFGGLLWLDISLWRVAYTNSMNTTLNRRAWAYDKMMKVYNEARVYVLHLILFRRSIKQRNEEMPKHANGWIWFYNSIYLNIFAFCSVSGEAGEVVHFYLNRNKIVSNERELNWMKLIGRNEMPEHRVPTNYVEILRHHKIIICAWHGKIVLNYCFCWWQKPLPR